MTIVPGRDLTVEVACSKSFTSWGGSSSQDACPSDAGSYHAGGSTGSGSGWWGNREEYLSGCALAIAYKSNVWDVQPEDFIVMSVQENCVRQRDTQFAIPANLPACPDGECTCAWFWQGRNSADEMYMNGFRCSVQGGVATAIPKPAPPKRGSTISGPTQPMYWANTPSNLDYTVTWESKPSYNRAFGWTNGAQTSAFASGGGGGGQDNSTDWNTSTTSSRTRRPRPTSSESTSTAEWSETSTTDSSAVSSSTPYWPNHVANPTSSAETPAETKPPGCKRKRSKGSKRSKDSKRSHRRSRAHQAI